MDPSAWEVVGLGIGTVFAGLILLIFVIKLTTLFTAPSAKKAKDAASVSENATTLPAAPAYLPEQMPHDNLVALCSAAIAEYLGDDVKGLRIKSITRMGTPCMPAVNIAERNAAIAAAVATAMGTDPAGLRIHSVTPCGAAAPTNSNTAERNAAIAAAIATAMGTEPQSLRIYSVRPL